MPTLSDLDAILAAAAVLAVGAALVLRGLSWRGAVNTGLFLALGLLPAAGGTVAAVTRTSELQSPAVWFSRASFGTFLVVGAVAILRSTRLARPSRAPGASLGFAALFYCSAALLTEVVAAGTAQRKTLLLTLGVLSVWLAYDTSTFDVLRWTKIALIAFIAGSGIAILVAPSQAWLAEGGTVIPGLDGRLRGLSSHPNGFGPLMILYLVAEHLSPSKRLIRLPFMAAAGVFLILAQSKTAWAAAIVVLVVYWWSRSPQRTFQLVGAVSTVAVLAVLGFLGLLSDVAMLSDDTAGIRTLTGRTEIWHVGIDAWRSDPVWGGGPTLYAEYANRTGQDWAAHAHNQFVNTLGEQGLVGFSGLLLYLGALSVVAIRTARVSNYWSVAVLGAFLMRTITENPIHTFGLEHLIVLSLLFAWERERAGGPFSGHLTAGRADRFAPAPGR